MGKNKVVLSYGEPFMGQPATVVMRQQGRDRFSVQYGLQVDANLDYSRAALKFGAGCMHFAACEGVLDNREVGER